MVVTASRVHTLPVSGLHQWCSVAGSPGFPGPPVTHTFLSMHCPHLRLQVLPMSISVSSSMCILQRMLEHIKTYGRENGNEWLCTGIRANCMSMKHIVEDLNDGTYIVMLCEVVELFNSWYGFNNEVSPGYMEVPLFHVCLLFCVWICNLLSRAGNEGLQWFHNHGKGPY